MHDGSLLRLWPDVSSDDLEQAQAGRVVARGEARANGEGKAVGRGFGAIVIERPIAEVWRTLARFDDRPEYIPRLKSTVVLEQTEHRVRVLQLADAVITTARTTLWFELDEAARRISWKLDHTVTDNTPADVEGDYRMAELGPSRTLLVYRAHIDTGRRVPGFIQAHMQKRAVPELLTAIKQRVESDGRYRK